MTTDYWSVVYWKSISLKHLYLYCYIVQCPLKLKKKIKALFDNFQYFPSLFSLIRLDITVLVQT